MPAAKPKSSKETRRNAKTSGRAKTTRKAMSRRTKSPPAPAGPPTDTGQLHNLALEAIDPCRFQTRRFAGPDKDNPALRDLAASIKTQGVIEPVIVRATGDRFELAAGERRFRASKLAGRETIPAIVRELDDRQLAEVAALENLQRVELHPLEEAEAIALLVRQDGWDQAAVAAQLGKSTAYVSQRARLTSLSEAWREVLADPEHPAHGWSAGHLILIARLEPAVQDRILKQNGNNVWFWRESIRELTHRVGHLTRELAKAPWSPKDAELLPEAGACTACPKRSSCYPGLFEDDEDSPQEEGQLARSDRCLDADCWAGKLERWLAAREDRLRKKHGEDLVLVGDGNKKPKRALSSWNIERLPKKAPDASPCLRVTGDGAGEFFWGKVRTPFGEEKARSPTVGDLRADLAASRITAVCADLAEQVEGCGRPPVPVVLALLLMPRLGADLRWWHEEELDDLSDLWSELRTLVEAGAAAIADRLWDERLAPALCDRLESLGHFARNHAAPPSEEGSDPLRAAEEELSRLAQLHGFDLEASRSKARDALPEPEAWDGLADDQVLEEPAAAA